jgi:Fe2+ or Zn2+ uptake regulation protein
MTKQPPAIPGYEERISHSGHRLTPQRREVYDVLLAERDHPTATEVFLRAKKKIPGISLATVYNCLETLVDCGLAKQVNVDRDATRYCPNLNEHGHFICERCGKVHDVPVAKVARSGQLWQLPKNFSIIQTEFTVRGLCPDCQN